MKNRLAGLFLMDVFNPKTAVLEHISALLRMLNIGDVGCKMAQMICACRRGNYYADDIVGAIGARRVVGIHAQRGTLAVDFGRGTMFYLARGSRRLRNRPLIHVAFTNPHILWQERLLRPLQLPDTVRPLVDTVAGRRLLAPHGIAGREVDGWPLCSRTAVWCELENDRPEDQRRWAMYAPHRPRTR